MPKFVIEREIPGAGKLSREELQAISQQSCAVLNELGPSIQWIQSFVGGDKIYCIYNAPSEELIRLHASKVRISCQCDHQDLARDRSHHGRSGMTGSSGKPADSQCSCFRRFRPLTRFPDLFTLKITRFQPGGSSSKNKMAIRKAILPLRRR